VSGGRSGVGRRACGTDAPCCKYVLKPPPPFGWLTRSTAWTRWCRRRCRSR
jgi:hypothetical protein